MSALPHELADLEAAYQRIYEQHTGGLLSYDEAVAALDTITTVDGSGAIWKVNPAEDGFLRADPGGPFTPCDPIHFAPLTRPAGPDAGPFPAASGAPWTATPGRNPQEAWTAPQPGAWPPAGDQAWGGIPAAPTGPTGGTPRRRLPSVDLSRVGGLLSRLGPRHKQLAVVAALVAVVAAFLLFRGGGEPSDGGVPVTPTPAPTVPVDPTAAPVDPTQPPAPAPAALPTVEDTTRVLTTFTSGDRAAIAAIVRVAPTDQQLLNTAIRYAGYGPAGVEVRPGPAAVGDGDRVVQRWEIHDTIRDVNVTTVTATWELADGVWYLTAIPE